MGRGCLRISISRSCHLGSSWSERTQKRRGRGRGSEIRGIGGVKRNLRFSSIYHHLQLGIRSPLAFSNQYDDYDMAPANGGGRADSLSREFQEIKLVDQFFPDDPVCRFASSGRRYTFQRSSRASTHQTSSTKSLYYTVSWVVGPTFDTLGTPSESDWHQSILILLGKRIVGRRVHA